MINRNIQDYIQIFIKILRAKNYMSFDLGLEHENEDPAYIQSAIRQLESTYHLVLLTDYFEESLILLKVSFFNL